MIKNKFSSIFLLLLFLLLTSCGNKPEPINYGQDECEFCRMQISDNRYGAELITDKGKVYKFDSIECLIEFAMVKNLIGDSNQILLVTDFSNPETFLDATSAFYVRNDKFRSPMGLNVSAFDSEISRQKFVAENSGQILNWINIIELVKQRSI
jgi:copper chaperone NosL